MNHRPVFTRQVAVASLLLPLLGGCGDPSGAPRDMGQPWDMRPGIDLGCMGPASRYRITELHIPTAAEADAGLRVGHNVDGLGTVCGVPDFAGGVDNSLIELSTGLTALSPPNEGIGLQAVIDQALGCPVDAAPSDCVRLDLIVAVCSGPGITVVAIEDGDGTSLTGSFIGSRDAAGNLSGNAQSLLLTLPHPAETGFVDVELDIRHVVLTATLGEDALTNIVLGGAIPGDAFEATLAEVLPFIGGGITFDEVQPIVASLYDVEIAGECSGLSVGFTGSATLEP